MDNNINNIYPAESDTPRRRRPLWRRILKWILVSVGALLLLGVAAVGVAVWMLSPDELTPMVSKYSSSYLNAQVTAGKVELKFWSTFPKVSLEVDDLTVVSNSLAALPDSTRAKLPADADTLLTLSHFSGGVNVWAMMGGTVMLYDVNLSKPDVNLVMVNDSVANYLIVPPGADSSSTSAMPHIAINRFALEGPAPVRFFSLADSIDVAMTLKDTKLVGSTAPQYTFNLDGAGGGQLPKGFSLPTMPFGVDGRIDWDQRRPDQIDIRKLTISANEVALTLSSSIDLNQDITLKTLRIDAPEIALSKLMAVVPQQMLGELSHLKTDIVASFSATLLAPYSISSAGLPDVSVHLKIPKGSATFDRINLTNLSADIAATLLGSDLNSSTVTINNLSARGRSIDFSLKGVATNLIDNPAVTAEFDGSLNFNTLPAGLWQKLKCHATGRISGKAEVCMHASDLTAKTFHRLKAAGKIDLTNFRFTASDSSLSLVTAATSLAFGTDAHLAIADTMRADSLLKLSLTSDSLLFKGDGIALATTGAKAVIAARNTAGSFDTTKINPLGIALRADRVYMRADSDSVTLTLRNPAIKASLRRFKNADTKPLLNLQVSAERARYSDALNRVSLSGAEASLTLHPVIRRAVPRDSAARARFAARRHRLDSLSAASGKENIDFEIDRSLASWLRAWKLAGTVKAKRGRLLTPYFPVRNTLRGLDMAFSTDSIVIHNTTYTLGSSDFLINGSISNISRALTSRRGSPLRINFNIASDTININQIYEASMKGSAFAERISKGQLVMLDNEDDDARQASLASQADSYDQPALVVPSNIDAQLNITAKEVLYADIWFQRLKGNIGIKDGAIHLNELAGYTPIGSLNLTALYSAPTKHDVAFAAGAVVRSLKLKEFLHLLPEIDSILPLLREVNGIVTAEMAMSTDIDSMMNLKFNTLNMVLKLSGDSLVLVDSETFRKMAKWLMFKHKNENIINSMKVELMIKDTKLDVFPFVFDIDRYRIGVSGHNSLDMDLDYHIAVLKSPLPFKFGINIKGKPDHLKIRLGRANFNENKIAFSRQLTDTLRMNLVHEIKEVFQFGARNGRRTKLMLESPKQSDAEFMVSDTLTHADSVIFIQGGAIEGPAVPPFPQTTPSTKKAKKKR